jgi:hypothetical protein
MTGKEDKLQFRPPQGGLIEVHGLAAFEARYGWRPQALPAFAGAEIRFADRARAAALMGENGIPVQKSGAEWFVAPQFTNGFILRLAQ